MANGTVSRPLIVSAALVAGGWAVVVALVRPTVLGWTVVLHAFPVLLTSAALVAAVLAILRRGPEPASFVVRDGAGFVVPPNRTLGYFVAGELLMLGYIVGVAVDWWIDPTREQSVIAVYGYAFAFLMTVLFVGLAGLVAALTVIAWGSRPRIELTPHAVELREVWGSQTVPWAALRPGYPVRSADRHNLVLTVDRPELVVRRGLTWRASRTALNFCRIEPWFLSDAIRFYVERPDRRAAIGTRAELDRLLADMATGARIS